ncbi:hypothetical protein [Prosthecodimorpha staleyi]|uniref:Uncharacterized protein n=1 Tax=Prosthecodimorpha staleyi TaxID=2840188 RepID=A0A947D376_9HYPH|nr:hypothetical protein [Prosthecodimorpha staleyi]MBT9288761.1 hypothetical protein [Prosthecodimorpha staleyi]
MDRYFIKFAAIAPILALTTCSTTVDMYPVSGPYSQVTPLPVIKATANGIDGNSGTLTLQLPDAQTCTGRWSSLAPRVTAVSSGNLLTQYGSLISGSFVTSMNVPGVNKGYAFLSCSKGTKIEAEFYTGSGTANGAGIAKDTEGNVYKMLF